MSCFKIFQNLYKNVFFLNLLLILRHFDKIDALYKQMIYMLHTGAYMIPLYPTRLDIVRTGRCTRRIKMVLWLRSVPQEPGQTPFQISCQFTPYNIRWRRQSTFPLATNITPRRELIQCRLWFCHLPSIVFHPTVLKLLSDYVRDVNPRGITEKRLEMIKWSCIWLSHSISLLNIDKTPYFCYY